MFFFAEKLVLTAVVSMVLFSLSLVSIRGNEVDLETFWAVAIIPTICFLFGMFYRTVRFDERVTTILFSVALLLLFAFAGNLTNHALLPLSFERWDEVFVSWDSVFGFHYPDWMTFWAQYPLAVEVLRQAYKYTFLEVLIIVIVLGITAPRLKLHGYMMSLVFGCALTILIWYFFPAIGGPSVFNVSPELEKAISPAVDREYAALLIDRFTNGMAVIKMEDTVGLIGFPSFHTVMIMLPIFFLKPKSPWFWIASLYALVTLPSILLHGGHHLTDVLGGITVAVVCVVAAQKLLAKYDKDLTTARAVQANQPALAG